MPTGRLRSMRKLDEAAQASQVPEAPRGQLRRLIPLFALALAVGFLAGVLPAAEVARACSCASFTPAERLERSDAVFHGRVTRMRWIETPDPDAFNAEVTFQVFDWWKGPEGPTFTLYTAGVQTFCDWPLVVGERYIVFADEESPGHFVRRMCSGTGEHDPDFALALGPPVVVAPFDEPPAVTCDPCDAPPPPSDALLSASAVFHGWAIDIEHLGEGRVGPRRITFQVVRWWKGGSESVVSLEVPHGYWFCFDQPFGLSRSEFRNDGYIVYADRDPESGALVAQRCGRTARFDEDEAGALGPGTSPEGATDTPTAEPTPTPEPTRDLGDPRTVTPSPWPTSEPGTVTPVGPSDPETRIYLPLSVNSGVVGSGSLELVRQVPWTSVFPGRDVVALERSVSLVDDIAYVGLLDAATDQSWIAAFDISRPAAPVLIGESEPLTYHEDAWWGMPLALSGSTLYAAASTAGLHVADVSDPARPRWIGHLPLGGDAVRIAIDGERAVLFEGLYSDIGDRGTDVERLHVLDISTPAAPRILGSTSEEMGSDVRGLAFKDGFAYAALHSPGLVTVDVRDPGAMFMTDVAGPDFMVDVLVHGDKILGIRPGATSGEEYGLWAYDRSIPSKPTFIDRYKPYRGTGYASPEELAADGIWTYVVDDGGYRDGDAPPALYAIDASDIAHLRLGASARAPRSVETWHASGLAAQDGLVVLLERESIYLYRHHRR